MPPHQTSSLDALPQSRAAASTRSIRCVLQRYWRAFQERRRAASSRTALICMSDRQLLDIGLSRDQVDYIAPQRAIDNLRDRATNPWTRGVI